MKPVDFTSQEGMEALFRRLCSHWPDAQAGRINELCRPQYVSCSFESRTLRLSYAVQDWMRNYADVMHGGVVCTVFDLTMGLLSGYCSRGLLTPTTNMQVTFLRPIPAGETLVAEAVCDMAGKTLCAVTAKAWLESMPEKTAATATATFYTGGGAPASGLFDMRE